MQSRLAAMLRHPPNKGVPILANSTAGLGSVFVAAGDKHLKPGGRIALVLPEALGFGVAWEKTRELLDTRYVVEMLIVSHDPERWNFSENTDLSEILLVARKRLQGEKTADAETICVNLWRNTTTIVDAMALADAIQKAEPALVDGKGLAHGVCSLNIGGVKRGEAVKILWTALLNKQWHPCALAQTDLVRAAHFLRLGKAYFPGVGIKGDVPLVPLGSIGVLGPDRRDIKDGFREVDTPTAYAALWSHDAAKMTTIETSANKYLEPLNAALAGRKLKPVSHLWPKAGRLMLAESLWPVTQRVVAVRLQEEALSNVWWSLHLNDSSEVAEKALVLWLNSTLGLILLLSHRVPTRGPWMHFKKKHFEQIPVLDVSKLSPQQAQALADTYDQIARSALQPLPHMAQDAVRAQIDAAIADALGLPALDGLRKTLAREPIVSGEPLYPVTKTPPPTGKGKKRQQSEATAQPVMNL